MQCTGQHQAMGVYAWTSIFSSPAELSCRGRLRTTSGPAFWTSFIVLCRLVGVYLRDWPPCPALAANKACRMIGENLQEALGFPDKADRRARPGTGWTPDELNHILQAHVVDGSLTTFGCVEWESEKKAVREDQAKSSVETSRRWKVAQASSK